MQLAKILSTAFFVAAGLYLFGRFFVSQLTTGQVTSEPPGVILAPTPDVIIEEGGQLSRTEAARDLEKMVAERHAAIRFGIHFQSPGHEIYWIVDRSIPDLPILIERSAGAAGTRLETRWAGGIDDRLTWGRTHGNFDAPGLPPGERRNLYH